MKGFADGVNIVNIHDGDFMNLYGSEGELVTKPFPNEHSARITNPGKYKEFRRRNNFFRSGIHAIFGIWIKNGKRTSEIQSIRFDAKKYTVAQAKKWLKDHDIKYISFEPATGKGLDVDEEQRGVTYGHVLENKFVDVIDEEGKATGEKRFQPRFRFTELAVDRHGEVVVTGGGDLENWINNPQIYFGHGWGAMFSGGIPSVGLGVPETLDHTGKKIDSDIYFDDDGDDPFATLVSKKVQKGFLRMSSIGFKSFKRTPPEEPVLKGQTGVAHTKWELYEASIVPIPALVKARRLKEQEDIREEFDTFVATAKAYGHAYVDEDVYCYIHDEGLLTKDAGDFLGFPKKIISVVQINQGVIKEGRIVVDSLREMANTLENMIVNEDDVNESGNLNLVDGLIDQVTKATDKVKGCLRNVEAQ